MFARVDCSKLTLHVFRGVRIISLRGSAADLHLLRELSRNTQYVE